MDLLKAGSLNQRVRFERRVVARDEYMGERVTWETVAGAASVPASVLDYLLFNNGESAQRGEVRQLTIPTRVIVRYRPGISTDMRLVILGRERIMQIISIAEIGRGVGLQMMCENYSTTGQ